MDYIFLFLSLSRSLHQNWMPTENFINYNRCGYFHFLHSNRCSGRPRAFCYIFFMDGSHVVLQCDTIAANGCTNLLWILSFFFRRLSAATPSRRCTYTMFSTRDMPLFIFVVGPLSKLSSNFFYYVVVVGFDTLNTIFFVFFYHHHHRRRPRHRPRRCRRCHLPRHICSFFLHCLLLSSSSRLFLCGTPSSKNKYKENSKPKRRSVGINCV